MPKSRVRVKTPYTPPPTRSARKQVSPPWVGPLMLGCFVLGIAWLVVFYFTSSSTENGLPIRSIGEWNLAIGFGFIIAGFGVSTQWR